MSYRARVSQVWQDKETVAYRAPQLYDNTVGGGVNILFNIIGPVFISLLGGRMTAAAGGASTIRLAVNGVNTDAAAVAINAAIGQIFISRLNVAGTLVNVAAGPCTDALLHSKGILSGNSVGTIQATFATATWTGDIFCVYRKLAPYSSINVA